MFKNLLWRLIAISIATLTLSSVAYAADCYWVNDSGDNSWTNTNNWASSSGGAGGTCAATTPAGYPDGGDDHAYIDGAGDGQGGGGNNSLTIPASTSLIGLSIPAGYSILNTVTVGGDLTIGNEHLLITGGLLAGPGSPYTITFDSAAMLIGANRYSPSDETIRVIGSTSVTSLESALVIENLIVDKDDQNEFRIDDGDFIQVTGTASFLDGRLTSPSESGGNLYIANGADMVHHADFDGGDISGLLGSANIVLKGSTARTVNLIAPGKLPNFYVDSDATNTTVNLTGTGTVSSTNSITVSAGTFNMNALDLSTDNSLGLTGGIFNQTNSANDITVSETLIIRNNPTYNSTAGTITAQAISINSSTGSDIADVDFSNMTVDVENLVVGDTLGGSGSLTMPSGNINISLALNHIDSSTPINYNGGTLYFDDNTSTSIITKSAVDNIEIAKDGASTQVNLSNNLEIDGNLTLTTGILDANGFDITIAGDWTDAGANASFTHDNRLVTFDGTNQSINGDNTFYSFTNTETSADTLTLQAGSTQTFATGGTLTLQGAAGNLLTLQSSDSASCNDASIDPQGTRTMEYLEVNNINNINGTQISTTGLNMTDLGGNTNWENFTAICTNTNVPEFSAYLLILTVLAASYLGYKNRHIAFKKL